MTKFLKSICIIACIFSMSAALLSVEAKAEEKVILEIGAETGKVGDEIEIPINIKNSSQVATLDLTVIYDPEELSLISAKAGGSVSDGNICSINPVKEKAYIRFVFSSLKEIPKDGNVMSLTFNVLESTPKKHTVDMDVLGVYDMDIEELSWQIEGGREIAPMEGSAEEWIDSDAYSQNETEDSSEKTDKNQDDNIEKKQSTSGNVVNEESGSQRKFFVKTEDGIKDVTETAGKETAENLRMETVEDEGQAQSVFTWIAAGLIIVVLLSLIIVGRRVYKIRQNRHNAGE